MDGPVIQQAVDVAVRAGVGMRDVLRAVEAVAAAGAVPVVMTLLEPDRALRGRPVRRRPGRRRGSGRDHARPDPGRGRRLARGRRRRRPRPGLPRRAVLDRRPAGARPRPPAAASSTPPRRWASPAPARTVGDAAETLVARTRAVRPTSPVCVGLGRLERRAGRRGRRVRRRRHRRLGLRAGACSEGRGGRRRPSGR